MNLPGQPRASQRPRDFGAAVFRDHLPRRIQAGERPVESRQRDDVERITAGRLTAIQIERRRPIRIQRLHDIGSARANKSRQSQRQGPLRHSTRRRSSSERKRRRRRHRTLLSRAGRMTTADTQRQEAGCSQQRPRASLRATAERGSHGATPPLLRQRTNRLLVLFAASASDATKRFDRFQERDLTKT
jgi:hypothetical protein